MRQLVHRVWLPAQLSHSRCSHAQLGRNITGAVALTFCRCPTVHDLCLSWHDSVLGLSLLVDIMPFITHSQSPSNQLQ